MTEDTKWEIRKLRNEIFALQEQIDYYRICIGAVRDKQHELRQKIKRIRSHKRKQK